MYVRKESSAVSFGKLSDPYTVENSPLSASKSRISVFNTANFQAIVDETAQMYGYGKGQIRACVEKKDRRVFLSRDTSGSYSLQLQFTMNANIAPYRRITQYGQHFMYEVAKDYGKEITFGIVGHEIGHLVENKILDDQNVQNLIQKTVGEVDITQIQQETFYDNTGNPHDIFLIENPLFISQYQGRVYCETIWDAFDDEGNFKSDLLWEFSSEGFREYIENPEKLKKRNPELYSMLEEALNE